MKEELAVKIAIDEDKCCGAGTCVMVAPDLFDQRDDDAVVILLEESPPEEHHDAAREAAAVCPGAAISVVE